MFRTLLFAVSFSCIAVSAKSHEFWIDPTDFFVTPGQQIVADLRVGQDYKGGSQPFLPPQFHRFETAYKGKVEPVPGRMGDRPALTMDAPGDGLVTVIHETGDFLLTWDEWERFVGFVEHKDAEWALAEHERRGLDQKNFREVYSRYAKSLIAVGSGAGEDITAGMEIEIVALENPYTGNISDGVDVRVLYQGKPRTDAQVEIFEKAPDGAVTVFKIRTDGDGKATIPVKAGHRYMVDSVVIRQPSAEKTAEHGAVWESVWANLTFEAPSN